MIMRDSFLEWFMVSSLQNMHPEVEETVRYMYHNAPSGRYPLFKNQHIEVVTRKWNPAEKSMPHNHEGIFCAWKVIQGSLIETKYHHDKLINVQTYRKNEIGYEFDSLKKHTILNPTIDPAISIHFYANR